MDRDVRTRDPYLIKSVVHFSQLLTAFRSSGEAIPLREIVARSGLPKTMVFRLLYTLDKCGLVEKVGANLYQSCLRPWKQKLYRLGYAGSGLSIFQGSISWLAARGCRGGLKGAINRISQSRRRLPATDFGE